MSRWMVSTSIRFRFLVIVLAAVLIAFGLSQIRNAPVDVLPEFSPPYVEIQTEALGLSAEEVEQMITVPMEQDLLAGVAWLDVIHSESVPGLSSVLVYFQPGTDLYQARQMVTERLSQAAVGLPHVSKPPTMIQPLSSSSRFMIVGLSSEELSLIDMGVLARWVIGPRLMGVPGVAHVAIWGQRDRQLQVLVDPEKLQDAAVTLQQVVETTGNALWVSSLSFLEASTPGTGGFIDTPNQRLGVWHVLPISSPDELAQVPVQGTAWRLADVADVVEDHQPLIGDAVINDNSNLLLVIEKLPEINTLEVTQGIEDALAALRPGFKEINFDATLFRPASFIEMAMGNLSQTFIIAAVLGVLIMSALFYGWRSVLIAVVAIPLSLMVALFVLYQRGATMNTMVLTGLVIALGAIIDEVIIDVDHIKKKLLQNRESDNPSSPESVILEASSESRGAIFFGTVVLLIAILPVFVLEGTTAAILSPMAVSYILAILSAMLVAMIVTPALSRILVTGNTLGGPSPLMAWMERSYHRMVGNATQATGPIYGIVVLLFVAGVALVPLLRQIPLVPVFREPYVAIELEAAPGTSLQAMSRIVGLMSDEVSAMEGVQDVGAHIGRAIFGDINENVNSGEIWVSIDPDADYDQTVQSLNEIVSGYPGLQTQVQTYLQRTLAQPLSRSDYDVTVRLLGEDHEVLRTQAEQLRNQLANTQGVTSSSVDLPVEETTLEIEVNLNSAQIYGVKPGDVRRSAAILLSGLQVGSLFEEQKVFDVVVWGVPEIRNSLSDINDLLIDTPGGGHVRLGEIADVRITSSPTVIQREGVSPYLDIGFNIEGRSPQAVANDFDTAIKGYAFPLEYHAEVLNDFADQQAIQQRILIAGFMALFAIFLFLQSSYGNWRLAIVNILTIPAALAGGLLVAFLGGNIISIGSLFGLLAVLGINIRSNILMIKQYQHLEWQEGMPFGPELVQHGSEDRLAAIMTTTLTTAFIFAPLAIAGNVPGLEILYPMALIVLGGLVSTTILNLFGLPVLYLRFGMNSERDLMEQAATLADEMAPAD